MGWRGRLRLVQVWSGSVRLGRDLRAGLLAKEGHDRTGDSRSMSKGTTDSAAVLSALADDVNRGKSSLRYIELSQKGGPSSSSFHLVSSNSLRA